MSPLTATCHLLTCHLSLPRITFLIWQVFFGEFEDIAHGFAGYGGYVIWAMGIVLNAIGLSYLAPIAKPDAADATAAMPPMEGPIEDPSQPVKCPAISKHSGEVRVSDVSENSL